MNVEKILKKTQAILSGHFLLSSGLHSEKYVQCASVFQHPEYAAELCKQLGKKINLKEIDVVIAPAIGGVLVAYELARALKAKALFTERKNGKMLLRRNFSLKPGDRIIVAEDVVTTGKSTKEVIKAVKQYKPKILAIACIINRSNKKNIFGKIPFRALYKINVKTYKPKHCPLCKQGIEIYKPGSRQNLKT